MPKLWRIKTKKRNFKKTKPPPTEEAPSLLGILGPAGS